MEESASAGMEYCEKKFEHGNAIRDKDKRIDALADKDNTISMLSMSNDDKHMENLELARSNREKDKSIQDRDLQIEALKKRKDELLVENASLEISNRVEQYEKEILEKSISDKDKRIGRLYRSVSMLCAEDNDIVHEGVHGCRGVLSTSTALI